LRAAPQVGRTSCRFSIANATLSSLGDLDNSCIRASRHPDIYLHARRSCAVAGRLTPLPRRERALPVGRFRAGGSELAQAYAMNVINQPCRSLGPACQPACLPCLPACLLPLLSQAPRNASFRSLESLSPYKRLADVKQCSQEAGARGGRDVERRPYGLAMWWRAESQPLWSNSSRSPLSRRDRRRLAAAAGDGLAGWRQGGSARGAGASQRRATGWRQGAGAGGTRRFVLLASSALRRAGGAEEARGPSSLGSRVGLADAALWGSSAAAAAEAVSSTPARARASRRAGAGVAGRQAGYLVDR
jgi:hypothetical protein